MSKKGYVATAGGFCVAISSRSVTEETHTKKNAVTSTNTATESQIPLIQSATIGSIKKSA
ncbi:MAG: hypothetical protein GX029_12720 [Pseudomonadaceae bacterium]|nr:hypothetical protein [Pseudomonadaceae bacterium]